MTTSVKEESLCDDISEQSKNSAKCGEVFVTKRGIFSCFCIVCKQNFEEILSFTEHILTLHLGLIPSKPENISNLEKINNNNILLQLDIANDFLEIKMDDPESMLKSATKSKKKKTEITSNNNPEPDPLDINKLSKSDKNVNQFSLETDKKLEETGQFKELNEDRKSIDSNENSPANSSENKKFDLFPFKCDICKKSFKMNYNLLSHKKSHEKLMPNCQHCGKYFRERSAFKIHNQILCAKRIKRGQKLKLELPDIKCKYCDKIFKKTAFLKKHEERHEDSPFKCSACPKKFMAKQVMEDHVRTHTGEKPYKCQYCPVAIATARNLKRHILIHVGERTCVCTFGCGKAFYTQHERTAHERTHTGEKPYKCEYCPVAFLNATTLKRHILRHVGERNYLCSFGCGKSFYTERERTGHERSHTGEKPFVCELCGRYFAFQHQLSLHKKRFHMDKKTWPHKCDQCDKAFITRKELREHMVVHTGEKHFACDLCSGRFSKSSGLREHQKLHSGVKKHVCTICSKAFAQNAGLYSHMKSHGIIKQNIDDIS